MSTTAPDSPRRLYVLDGANLMFRAFHAIRSLTNSQGMPTNALYGFTSMLLKLLKDEHPDLLAVAFDTSAPTFRHEMSADYKANRAEMPEDLRPQVPYIARIAAGLRIPYLALDGWEADDIIATLTRRALADGIDVFIVSSDKDLMQLVGPHVTMVDTMVDKRYDVAGVQEKWGVPPSQIRDLLALTGDTSDNIKGVHGIGPKTAAKLLTDFGDLDGVFANLAALKGATLTRLQEGREDAYRAQALVTLRDDAPVPVTWDELRVSEPDRPALTELFRHLEFKGFIREFHAETPKAPDAPRERQVTVLDTAQLDEAVAAIRASGRVSFDLETTSVDPVRARIVGIALAPTATLGFYIPVAHHYLGVPPQLPLERVLDALRPVLEDPTVEKLGQNYKYDYLILLRHGVTVRGVAFDTMIASYLIDPGKYQHNLDNIALDWLNHKTIKYEDVTGSGKSQITFAEVDIPRASAYACEDALVCARLTDCLRPIVEREGLAALMTDIELPLSRVLAHMELHGILLDVAQLHALSTEMGLAMARLEQEIWDLAGERFAVGSPKQLGQILFDRLKLPKGKKTKTGWSTDSSVLEDLAASHPICAKVLEWRQSSKLKSTYCDTLPGLVNPETGRIHTSYNQAVAATGRLSSSDPNLQNIPVRTEAGRRIRQAFVAAPGHVLLSADYSQIELRLLADIAGDEGMIQAFVDGADIHTRTASEVFGVPLDEMTPEIRGRAKAINFGIVYGMSAFRLANDLGISKQDAQAYIDGYFARYPKVRTWLDETMASAHATGLVTTRIGRKRPLPDIESTNFNVRAGAERMAINTPIQGSAADLIKIAMIRVAARIEAEGLASRMALQVHDELVFEVPEGEVERLTTVAREEMEGVDPTLRVPLVVDVYTGRTWSEAHG
ncbi:MAG: DNA polymerase I [Myxococcales bacterium]